jgi:hypothetical protein
LVSPHRPPNSSAPDKSTTTAEPRRYYPKSRQHPDETLESNAMKMAGHDGKSQQVDPATPGQSLSLQFNHDFAVIIIPAGPRIVTQQVTATNHAIHDMHNRNFIRRKHFRSCHPRHHSAPNQNRPKPVIRINLSKIATQVQFSSVSPRFCIDEKRGDEMRL